jgi:hypothetical protein
MQDGGSVFRFILLNVPSAALFEEGEIRHPICFGLPYIFCCLILNSKANFC